MRAMVYCIRPPICISLASRVSLSSMSSCSRVEWGGGGGNEWGGGVGFGYWYGWRDAQVTRERERGRERREREGDISRRRRRPPPPPPPPPRRQPRTSSGVCTGMTRFPSKRKRISALPMRSQYALMSFWSGVVRCWFKGGGGGDGDGDRDRDRRGGGDAKVDA